jgi:hypothetical protein
MPSKASEFLTLWTGRSAEGNQVLRAQLSGVAAELGYVTDRGPATGKGSVRMLLSRLIDGHLAIFEVDEEYDPAVARWLREQAAGMNPTEYLPDALGGIASAIEEAIFRKRRRDREEMDALNADAGAVAPGE